MNHFRSARPADGTNKTKTNVNRRFTGRELKCAVAAADDETKEKSICLTLETSWKN